MDLRASSVVFASFVLATQACGHEPAAPARGVASPFADGDAAPPPLPAAAAFDPAKYLAGLKDLCQLPASAHATLENVAPYAPIEPKCDHDPFCDFVDHVPPGAGTCFVANDNLRRAERDSAGATPRTVTSTPWNGAPPKFLDRIDAHYHLTSSEHALLAQNGFVVLDRKKYVSYAAAFHDVFQEQLPLYVSLDPVYHAVFKGTELLLASIERKELRPALGRLLRTLRRGLGRNAARYAPETVADLDTYLSVAESVARDDGQDGSELAQRVQTAQGLEEVTLFGRPRMVDFSQFQPRGHYASAPYGVPSLSGYFRAVQWLSRIELNVVSRGCQSSHAGVGDCKAETPREARDALALAELAAQAEPELRRFEKVYSTFAGAREDVDPASLRDLMRRAGVDSTSPDAPAAVKAAIGTGFARTVATHFNPEGGSPLPAIATLIGLRITPDIAPLTGLVHDQIPERKAMTPGGELGYVLGHDAAKPMLAADLQAFPSLQNALDSGRSALRAKASDATDAYGTWLRAILALGEAPSGVVPSYYAKPAFAARRMEAALVAYGQLRHTFVLLAAQGYDSYGCEIPDAYVEPEVAALDRLVEHVAKLRSLTGSGYQGLGRTLGMLRRIAARESTGAALPEADVRWLGMVSELTPKGGYFDSGEPPKWTGWYYDMFEDREHSATETAAFVADYFTMTNDGTSQVLGAEGPRLGVFVVDVGGEPRAMVGPVAKGYAATVPLERGRATDESPPPEAERVAPWRSYAAAPADTSNVAFATASCGGTEYRVVVAARNAAGPVHVQLLDHHGDALGRPLTMHVAASQTPVVASFTLPASFAHAGAQGGFDDLGPPSTVHAPLDVPGVALHVEQGDLHLRAGPTVMHESGGEPGLDD